jgi:hypothetical protein
MAAPGVEMLVGMVNDAQFGPTIVCGTGGTAVELLKDLSVRLTPLAATDAAGVLRELRGYPLLTGLSRRRAMRRGRAAGRAAASECPGGRSSQHR